jgi:hypothetical protein
VVRTVALSCNQCGALLDPPADVRFITCLHCHTRLQIERTDDTAFTKVLETVSRVEQRVTATAATIRVIEIERELEKIDAKLGKLKDPGGTGVMWMCIVIAGFGGLLFIGGRDVEAQAAGCMNVGIFGAAAIFFAVVHPRRRREYDTQHAALTAQRAECDARLQAAREDAARERSA